MTQNEASVFLMELTTIYPTLKIGYETAKVWSDHLPDLSLEKAKDLLDKWLDSEAGDKAPKLDFFVKGGKIRSGGERSAAEAGRRSGRTCQSSFVSSSER